MTDIEAPAPDFSRNVNLDEATLQIIITKQARMLARDGKASFSAAVREIVNEWHQRNAARKDKAHVAA